MDERASRTALRLAEYVVVRHDASAREIAVDYWEASRGSYEEVVGHVVRLLRPDAAGMAAYESVVHDPTSVTAFRQLHASLVEALVADEAAEPTFALLLDDVDCETRIGVHLGMHYDRSSPPVDIHDLLTHPPARGPRTTTPEVHVIIPFRDATGGERLRNLVACLLSLRDQSAESGSVAVTVVESDARPRWERTIEPLVDHYLFAENGGLFNKSWAVNVGAVNAPVSTSLLCILDADVLPDWNFVRRGAERLGASPAFLPSVRPLCLDAPSSAAAIRARCLDGSPTVDVELLRAHILRDPPGHCLWIRSDAFHSIGGFDERYAGWGGEDDDVVARLEAAVGVTRFDDILLHLDHTRPAMMRPDGTPFNAHIPPRSWAREVGYGRLSIAE